MADWLRIAHRGASSHAPENTIAAFKRALEMGTDVIEMDVHLSRDGKATVIHDSYLDRTTDLSGPVSGLTLDEIKRADAGIKFSAEFKGERIPSLSEALEAIPRTTSAWVEIKILEATRTTLQIIDQMEREDHVSIISFGVDILRLVRGRNPKLTTTLIFGKPVVENDPVENAREMLRRAQSVGATRLSIELKLVTREAVDEIHNLGGTVFCWTANRPDDIQAAIEAGVDGITSNDLENLNRAYR